MSERPPQAERVTKDYYDIIGMSRDATLEELKERCRSLLRASHPDTLGGEGSEGKRKEAHELTVFLNTIYETFKNPEKRRLYDQSLSGGALQTERAVHEYAESQRREPRQERPSSPRLSVEFDGVQFYIRGVDGRITSVFDQVEYPPGLLVGLTRRGSSGQEYVERRIINKLTGRPSYTKYSELRMVDAPSGFQVLVGTIPVNLVEHEALIDPDMGEPYSRKFDHIWFDPTTNDGMLCAGMGGNKRRDPRHWLIEYRLDPKTGHHHLSKSAAA